MQRSELQTNLAAPWTTKGKSAIAPVILMVEGVHVGNRGAILHKAETLKNHAAMFNGIPVTLGHPQDANGNYISANEGGTKLGVLWDVAYDEQIKGLRGKVHICLTGANCQKGRQANEVSIGVFSEEVEQAGVWGSEFYDKIAVNYKPDHLALLTDQVGACSWADGCGVRVNIQANADEDDDYKLHPFYQEAQEEELRQEQRRQEMMKKDALPKPQPIDDDMMFPPGVV
jgi:hypothetical protein